MITLKMPKGQLSSAVYTRKLFFFCWIAYVFAYLGRLNYAACLVEIVSAEGWSKSQAGLIATGFFLSYGMGQLINGYIGDKLSPKIMVFCGLFCSGLVNFLFPFMPSPAFAAGLWCINGFVQSMLWSPLIRQLSEWMPVEKRIISCVNMNSCIPVGTLTVYGLSAAFVYLGTWKTVFFVSGTLLLSMSFVWFIGLSSLEKFLDPCETPINSNIMKNTPTTSSQKSSLWRLAVMSALPFCFVALFMQGALKDGVTTWIPTFLGENFGLTSAASILCTTVVPIINLSGVYLASWANRRFFKNENTTGILFFGVAFVALMLLTFGSFRYPVFPLLLLAITTTFMMGINTLFTCMMPSYFVSFGLCSTITGLLNACAYIGSAVSSYGNGAIVEHFGWNSIMHIWCICAMLGLVFSCFGVKKWESFRKLTLGADL